MAKVPVHNRNGEVVGEMELRDDVFAVLPNEALVHQAVMIQRGNMRRGTASTKTRSTARGSTAKLRRQKGTGAARRGSLRSPLHRGGGVVFGPHPRSFARRMPQKMRQGALRSVLSSRLEGGQLSVLEELRMDKPKTAEAAAVLEALGLSGSVLLVTEQPDVTLARSVRNLPGVDALSASQVSVVNVTSHRHLLLTVGGARGLEERLAPDRRQALTGVESVE